MLYKTLTAIKLEISRLSVNSRLKLSSGNSAKSRCSNRDKGDTIAPAGRSFRSSGMFSGIPSAKGSVEDSRSKSESWVVELRSRDGSLSS